MIHTIDLHFQREETIAAYLIESQAGLILVECGPYSTYDSLQKGVEALGFSLREIKHVLLTHIHFDHAGAAWALAELGATIYVHPVGYPHMLSPERLYNSAKRIYGDAMESLWGEMKPIPEAQLKSVEDKSVIKLGGHSFTAWHTPGHASHHIAWQLAGNLFTGDVAGVKIGADKPVVPPCPPPDINLEAWADSLARIRAIDPTALYLTHYGVITEVEPHLQHLEAALVDWSTWVKREWEQGKDAQTLTPIFQAYITKGFKKLGLNDGEIAQYEAANPSWMSVAGLIRYWKKKKNREAAQN